MTEFNPLAGAILSSAVTQTQSADAKRQQIRKAQLTRSNTGAREDTFEPHVESTDELHATDDRQKQGSDQQHQKKKPSDKAQDDVEHDHIDLCG